MLTSNFWKKGKQMRGRGESTGSRGRERAEGKEGEGRRNVIPLCHMESVHRGPKKWGSAGATVGLRGSDSSSRGRRTLTFPCLP